MKKYKAIISDVDGTLIPTEDSLPSQKTIDAIKRAHLSNLHVSTATARSWFELDHIIPPLGLIDPCAVSGGAVIIDPKTMHVLSEKVINHDSVHTVRNIALERNIVMSVEDNGKFHILDHMYTPDRPITIFTRPPIPAKEADTLLLQLATHSNIHPHKVGAYTKGDVFVLVNHPEATKQHGVLEIAERLRITPSEIIGIGDSYNDFPLLEACGLKIAMGNATPELKAIADYIAPSVEDDGVAHVIEKFMLN